MIFYIQELGEETSMKNVPSILETILNKLPIYSNINILTD